MVGDGPLGRLGAPDAQAGQDDRRKKQEDTGACSVSQSAELVGCMYIHAVAHLGRR